MSTILKVTIYDNYESGEVETDYEIIGSASTKEEINQMIDDEVDSYIYNYIKQFSKRNINSSNSI